MQNKTSLIIVVFISALLAGHGAVYADSKATQQAARKQSEATMQKLGELDSKIAILKKELEIKKLENKITKAKNEKKNQLQLEKDALKLRRQLGQMPLDIRSTPKSVVPSKPPASQRQLQKKQQQDDEPAKQFDKYIARARVISIRGVDENIHAEIRLPSGGSLAVQKGQNTDRLGQIKAVSFNSVVVKKHGKIFNVPFSEKFKQFSAAIKSVPQENPGFDQADSEDSTDVSP